MTAVAANGLPTLRAIPLFNTPIKGMPAPARRDHAAKIKYERIWGAPARTLGNGAILLHRSSQTRAEPKQTTDKFKLGR
jgi:hypothetical protein